MKAGTYELAPLLQMLFNYFIERREFPKGWCEGLSIALFKAGDRLDPACYRRLKILSVFEKIFEIAFNNRFDFLNEAYNKIDMHNNGFLKGARTSDNIFIFQSLVSRQLNLNKPLYVCFVDFSKAFDTVPHDLLLRKLHFYGIRGTINIWFADYLANRRHITIVDGIKSSPAS